MGTWVGRFVEGLAVMSPGFLVELVGVILALVWWRRHPRVSLLTVLALGLILLLGVGGLFVFVWLPDHLRQRGWTFEQTTALLPVIMLARNVLGALAFTPLLFAIFIDRSSKSRLQRLPTGAADAGARQRWEAGGSEHITGTDRPRD